MTDTSVAGGSRMPATDVATGDVVVTNSCSCTVSGVALACQYEEFTASYATLLAPASLQAAPTRRASDASAEGSAGEPDSTRGVYGRGASPDTYASESAPPVTAPPAATIPQTSGGVSRTPPGTYR